MHMEQVFKKWKNQQQKKHDSFEIYEAGYHGSSYLLLLWEKNYKVFKFPVNNFCYFEIEDSPFKPLSDKRRTSKLQN